jgi:hypothetical protein
MVAASQRLMRMGFGFAQAQALHVVAELRIAELLHDGSRTVEALAEATGSNLDALYRVLRFLAGEGVFHEERPGRFAQTELSDALRADAPASPCNFIRMINREAYAAWAQLMHTVKTGETAFTHVHGSPRFEWLASHPEEAALFQLAMVSLNQEGGHDEAAQAYDFSSCRKVVDVGGGHGRLLSAIVTRNPHLTGVLLDLASGIEAARMGMGGPLPRSELVVGDFFKSVPAADTYLLKKVIHDWDDESAVRIFTNCREAMAPGGRVLLLEKMVPSGNEPDPIKLMDVNMLAVTGGMERSREQYERLLAKASLRLARVLPAGGRLEILEAVTA